jgi:hypothetical protein
MLGIGLSLTAVAARRRPSGGAAPKTENIVVANRLQVPTVTGGIAANFTSKRQHSASPQGDITDLRCIDVNWYFNSAGALAGGSTTTLKKFVEYPAGVFHQVRWAAATTVTITTLNQAVSDVVISSVTGEPLIIPAGATFWERTVNAGGTTSGSWPLIELPAMPSAIGTTDGNSTSDLGNSGTINPSASSTNQIGSAAIMGTVLAANARAVAIVGDSIAFGQGDITGSGAKGGSGWIARGLDPLYPYVKLARGGQQAASFAAINAASLTSFIAAIGVTDAIFEHGVNDLRLGRTQAQLTADMANIAGRFATPRKWLTTLTPRSDTTDAYATTTNQTPKTDGNMAALTAVNAERRALPAGFTAVLDAADSAMPTRDANIWTAAATADGTHPNTAKCAAMAPVAALPSA